MYHQCLLTRDTSQIITWLDTSKVKIGSLVTLEDENKERSGIWTIDTIFKVEKTKEEVKVMERLYKTHRKGSDI